MRFRVTLGCAACGNIDTVEADTVFDCSGLICPKCKNEDCLSITSVAETTADAFKSKHPQTPGNDPKSLEATQLYHVTLLRKILQTG